MFTRICIVLFVLCALCSSTIALSCADVSLDQRVEMASAIFVGKFVKSETFMMPSLTFSVEKALKGEVPNPAVIVYEYSDWGMPELSHEQRYLVFAYTNEKGELAASPCELLIGENNPLWSETLAKAQELTGNAVESPGRPILPAVLFVLFLAALCVLIVVKKKS